MHIVSLAKRRSGYDYFVLPHLRPVLVIAICLCAAAPLVASAVAAPPTHRHRHTHVHHQASSVGQPKLAPTPPHPPDTSPNLQQQLHEIADMQARQAASMVAIMTRLDALPSARITPPSPDPLDGTVKRLQAENLAEQTNKARTDRRVAYLAPLATAASVLLGFVGIFIQQRLTARANLTVKALELVMTADTPFVAEGRYNLLQRMFGRWPPAQFQGAFDPGRFPGLRVYAMALELFKAAAAKCGSETEVRALFAGVFPDWEGKWQPNLPAAAPKPPPP